MDNLVSNDAHSTQAAIDDLQSPQKVKVGDEVCIDVATAGLCGHGPPHVGIVKALWKTGARKFTSIVQVVRSTVDTRGNRPSDYIGCTFVTRPFVRGEQTLQAFTAADEHTKSIIENVDDHCQYLEYLKDMDWLRENITDPKRRAELNLDFGRGIQIGPGFDREPTEE
jgi:hypothetical protein